jgi:flavin reductase (DIM6/NTAB) family NADH-FMN oxidoreductase RutF
MQQVAEPVGKREFNSRELREALGAFATGVTVVTTQSEGRPHGLAANAFASVSIDPPLVLACLPNESRTSEAIQQSSVFAVNILSAEQEPISRYFATEHPHAAEVWRELPHRRAVSGAPVMDGLVAFLDCRLSSSHTAGDYLILIGEVLALGHNPGAPPLLFHHGRYRYQEEYWISGSD